MFDRRKLLKGIGLGAGFIAGEPLLTAVAGLGGAVAQTTDTRVVELGAAQAVGEIFDGPAIIDTEYREFLEVHRPRYQTAYAEYFSAKRVDAMIFPATPLPARPIGHDETVELNGRQVPTFPTFIRNTGPASGAGIPGLVIPAGLTEDGLPVGLEIGAPVMSDRRLLAIGHAIESVLPRLPPPGLIGEGIRNDAP